ncbi:Phytoene/squalene synthetase [Ekhidna lutea]|uniref:Phytoene/squalene synthetase n=1 Tax=Ekhidna lutea TaxID=447679 RepID=A0A239KS15_EKHLU|nr:phytoene/squalene synthase family protein [Ekhidna lutea]SNT20004.1 Phytoene/squalene synthetase [Ekhidna lutea]
MENLYTQTAFDCSKLITKAYSTSFSLGIRTLNKKYHSPIYAIYGFVRYADEIVDTFHEHDKNELLKQFRLDTYKSIEEKISLNPVLHSFQNVVNKYQIDHDLIEAFLISMEMDLSKKDYDDPEYKKYIYGSAEVVGLMCLKVFLDGNDRKYQELLEPAKHLGAAFQKVNFLRDIKSDFDERGRVYFPGIDFNQFTRDEKRRIEKDIQNDFQEALKGIKKLPNGVRAGVYLAYIYYTVLFKKITRLSPERIKSERIRIPNGKKFLLLVKCYFLHKFNFIVK